MIDPLQLKIAELYAASRPNTCPATDLAFEIVDAMAQRLIDLERRSQDQAALIAQLQTSIVSLSV